MRLTSVIGSASLCFPPADRGTVLVLTRPPDRVLLRPPPVIRVWSIITQIRVWRFGVRP